MGDAGDNFKTLLKCLIGPEILIDRATEILLSIGQHEHLQQQFMKYGFFRALKVIPVSTLINLFGRFTSENHIELKNYVIGEFENITRNKGTPVDKKQLFDSLANFTSDPTIVDIRARLDEQIQNFTNSGTSVEGVQSHELIDYDRYQFVNDESLNKELKIGISLSNGRLDLADAQSVNVTQITSKSTIEAIENIQPNEREIYFYRLSEYPKFYKINVESNADIGKGFRYLCLDQCFGTLQDNINAFHKLGRADKAAKKAEREEFANLILKQIVGDLLLFRSFNMFHAKIVPENILLFHDKNDPNKVIAKIINGRCKAYERASIGTVGETIEKVSADYAKKFYAPEICEPATYKTKLNLDTGDINFNVCDVFSLGVITLNILTDKLIDRWNNIAFCQTLIKTIKETVSNEALGNLILEMTEINYNNRIRLELVANKLGII